MPTLRLAAYNVHGFRSGTRRVAEALADVAPDVLLLNETGYAGLALGRFARRAGMQVASGLHGVRRIPNAVLARPPWRIVEARTLRFRRLHRTVRRGAVVAVVGRAGARVAAVAVHLGLSSEERREHVRALSDHLAGRAPVVVGGDLNEEPDGDAARWLADRLWDAFAVSGEGRAETFPSAAPRARIDYLFVSGGVRVERAWVGSGAGGASDHLPVFAEVSID